MSAKEQNARYIIDNYLRDAGWILPDNPEKMNVDTEFKNEAGRADYLLKDSKGFPIGIVEAKHELKSPLAGKEQARNYAKSLNCRFVILSNGISHYQWDINQGNPFVISKFPTQRQLELHLNSFNPPREETEEIESNYLALTQLPSYADNPDYQNESTREDFKSKNNLKFLRYYQLEAVKAVKNKLQEGSNRFLLEMATGTGKTNTATAIIKMFLRLYKVKRVLFLVDRLELEDQGKKEINDILSNDYETVVWKEHKNDWIRANIVVSTVQSFISKNKYKRIFKPDDFGLVISDEAHRSLGERSRSVFEYFIGFKLGLTATPRDYLKSVDADSLSIEDPKQLERRIMMDTYTIFGCEDGEPTYRYSLADGVKDGYLVNPTVIKLDTGITAEMMSKQGILFKGVDKDGNDLEEEQLYKKDYRKRFLSDETDISFCRSFIQNAKRDPYTNEIGKTLIFCVSQSHARDITQILNQEIETVHPGLYQSDFAVQVTSEIDNSQDMTVNFKNNVLNGNSPINEFYKSSKTRVCVTVGMMTTGYDCPDLLNVCLMRPVFSPSEFIQMKGRGTRLCNFANNWISKDEIIEILEPQKTTFLLFDYFQNYQYFEEEFDYDKILKLPAIKGDGTGEKRPTQTEVFNKDIDPVTNLEEIKLEQSGMRIDRELYKSFKDIIRNDEKLKLLVNQQKFIEAELYLTDTYLNKPQEYFTLEKLKRSLGLDRNPTALEILLYSFDHIKYIKSKQECIDDEFEKFDDLFKPDDEQFIYSRQVFETYLIDKEFREIIESGHLGRLNVHPVYESYKGLSPDIRQQIPLFIKEKVNLETFSDVR